MRRALVVAVVLGCHGSAAAPAARPDAAAADGPAPVRGLRETDRSRGGDAIVAPARAEHFDADRWAMRFGRFGSVKAMAVSPDGRVAIVYGADSPSTCLCDRDRGRGGSSAGALVRLTRASEGPPIERVLATHTSRRDYRVAASTTSVAAVEGTTLSVWPATGDGAAVTRDLGRPAPSSLAWATDRYLVATRDVDVDRTDVVVLDRQAAFVAVHTWPVAGTIHAIAARPATGELAIATTRYRATDVVHVDERRVSIHGLDGRLRARVDTRGYPASVAWSPRGDELVVSATGAGPAEQAVLRFDVE